MDNLLGAMVEISDKTNFMPVVYAFGASLFFLFFLAMTGLLKRDSKKRQQFVYCYFGYIPLVFMAAAFVWTSVGTVEQAVVRHIEKRGFVMNQQSLQQSEFAWSFAERFLSASDEARVPLHDVSAALGNGYGEALLGESIDSFPEGYSYMRSLFIRAREGLSGRLAYHFEQYVMDTSPELTEGSLADLKNLWLGGWQEELKGGLLVQTFVEAVPYALRRVLRDVQLFFFLFMLPVLIEVGHAFYQRPNLSEETKGA